MRIARRNCPVKGHTEDQQLNLPRCAVPRLCKALSHYFYTGCTRTIMSSDLASPGNFNLFSMIPYSSLKLHDITYSFLKLHKGMALGQLPFCVPALPSI